MGSFFFIGKTQFMPKSAQAIKRIKRWSKSERELSVKYSDQPFWIIRIVNINSFIKPIYKQKGALTVPNWN